MVWVVVRTSIFPTIFTRWNSHGLIHRQSKQKENNGPSHGHSWSMPILNRVFKFIRSVMFTQSNSRGGKFLHKSTFLLYGRRPRPSRKTRHRKFNPFMFNVRWHRAELTLSPTFQKSRLEMGVLIHGHNWYSCWNSVCIFYHGALNQDKGKKDPAAAQNVRQDRKF